jgi:hypothetical protein
MNQIFIAIAAAFATAAYAQAQESKQTATLPRESASPAARAAASPQELEAKFKSMLTNATLSGRWASIKDGTLGPEKEDKYHIVSVGKISGDSWVVNAKIKYNDREFVAPLPVKIKWAGDTPVIIVDNLTMPGGNRSYSARVMFYEHTYSGTWSAADHGGMLYGVISSQKTEKSKEAK